MTTWLAALRAVSTSRKRQQPDQAEPRAGMDAPGQPTSTTPGAPPGTPSPPPPPDARPVLGESEVHALVERWRTARATDRHQWDGSAYEEVDY